MSFVAVFGFTNDFPSFTGANALDALRGFGINPEPKIHGFGFVDESSGRRVYIPERKDWGNLPLCAVTISSEAAKEFSEFNNNSRVTFRLLNPLKALRPSDVELDDVERPHASGCFWLHIRRDLDEQRAVELIRQIKCQHLEVKLEAAEKAAEKAKAEAQLAENNLDRARVRHEKEVAEIRAGADRSVNDYREKLETLQGVIRNAAEAIGATRNFVRSKTLAALRERLEAALPPDEADEDRDNNDRW